MTDTNNGVTHEISVSDFPGFEVKQVINDIIGIPFPIDFYQIDGSFINEGGGGWCES